MIVTVALSRPVVELVRVRSASDSVHARPGHRPAAAPAGPPARGRRTSCDVAAGRAGGPGRGVGDRAHLRHHPEQRRLVDLGTTLLAQPGHGRLVLPHAGRRARQRPVRHLQVCTAIRIENPDPADGTRVAADHEPVQPVPPGDPRLQRVAVSRRLRACATASSVDGARSARVARVPALGSRRRRGRGLAVVCSRSG
jgi:hypothetical protein